MEKEGTYFPKTDTQAYRLLELVAVCGELPVGVTGRFIGSTSYREKVIQNLKKEGLLRVYCRDKLRGYRLGRRAKAMLLMGNPVRFSFYLTGNTGTNQPRSVITRRLRLHRLAEVYVNMLNAGVVVYRDEKPAVFVANRFPLSCRSFEKPCFYASREVKELGIEALKIKGSRMAGILLTHTTAFLTYNGGPYMAEWDYRAEQRAKALMQIVLCGKETGLGYTLDMLSGLLFGDSMETFYQILSSKDSGTRCFFLLDGTYEHFYYLTNDHRGEVMLKLLCDPDRKGELDRILSQDLNVGKIYGTIDSDAVDGNGEPVLFGYLLDIPRIHRFCNALQLQERHGRIICFDFQREVLERCYGELVVFETISFEKFERRFYP